MKIAMIGIYGGVNRDFNPGNVLIAFYTKREIEKRIKNIDITIFSLDYSLQKGMQKENCFPNTPFEMEINFFAYEQIEKICKILNEQYSAIILGGDIVIGFSDAFFLKNIINCSNHPKIIMNTVSTLWRPHLISNIQKKNIKTLAEESDYIAVREEYVEELFRVCGVTKDMYVVPDPVLLHEKSEWRMTDNVADYVKKYKKNKKKILGISDCFLRERDVIEALIKSSIIKDYTVVFFSYSKRYEHSEKAYNYNKILGKYCEYIFEYLNPWETFSLIENLDLCVGNAYHCCIAAITANTPFIGIDPSPFQRSRHTDILRKRRTISQFILKSEVVNNDKSGQTLQKYLENHMKNDYDYAFDLSEERLRIQKHFDLICEMLY